MAGSYRVLDHTADTAIAVSADSFSELLAWSVKGMVGLMFDAAEPPTEQMTVCVEAATQEDFAVDLLAEILVLIESADVVPVGITEVSVGNAEVVVDFGVAPLRHDMLVGPPIKAVTYHDLAVEEGDDGKWSARIVFDV